MTRPLTAARCHGKKGELSEIKREPRIRFTFAAGQRQDRKQEGGSLKAARLTTFVSVSKGITRYLVLSGILQSPFMLENITEHKRLTRERSAAKMMINPWERGNRGGGGGGVLGEIQV